jgi:hypothetical protein
MKKVHKKSGEGNMGTMLKMDKEEINIHDLG